MRLSLICAALLALLASCTPFCAAQRSKLDPKVEAIFKESLAAYKDLKALHEKVRMKMEASPPEIRSTMDAPESIEIRFQRPNKLYFDYSGKKQGQTHKMLIVCDGVSLWTWHSDANTYTKVKAPPTLAEIPGIPGEMPEIDILVHGKNPFDNIAGPGEALALKLAAPTKVGGLDVDVLEGKPDVPGLPFSMQIRMMVGQKDRLFRGLSVEGGGKNPAGGNELHFSANASYDLVDATPSFTAADFAFTPPSGAKLKAADMPKLSSSKPAKSSGKKKPRG